MTTADVWTFYEDLPTESRDGLSSRQRGVAAICDLRQEVGAGGFHGYFSSWGGSTAPEALAALPGCLGTEWAELLREAMDLLGPGYPTDQPRRESLVHELDLLAAFEPLDRRLYALEAASDANARLAAALAAPGDVDPPP